MSPPVSVTLKIATSLDSRIALSNGKSQWITNSSSRARVHEMRAAHDAVLVGVGTVLADDPLLTARTVPAPARQPVRIVADSRLRTPGSSRLIATAGMGRVVLAHEDKTLPGALFASGVETWPCGNDGGRVSPIEILRRCAGEGLNSVFLEGGGTLAASFLKLGLVSRIAWFRAPILIGGDGLPAIGRLGLDRMEEAKKWTLAERSDIEGDCLEIWLPDPTAP